MTAQEMHQETPRRELRSTIESVVLPFLGSRGEDLQPFQYLLKDISKTGLGVVLPQWLLSRERLHPGDLIYFHVPFLLQGQLLNQGKVAWQRWSEEDGGQLAGVSLEGRAVANYPIQISLDAGELQIDLGRFNSIDNLTWQIVHDSALLKRGILIYLRHLEAFFSRVAGFNREDYRVFRETIIADVRNRVQQNYNYLTQLEAELAEGMSNNAEVMEKIDIDELRRIMEPELYIELFDLALGPETSSMYLDSIKALESRLYANYNSMVMLYIQSLEL